jgi:hypothetical protein
VVTLLGSATDSLTAQTLEVDGDCGGRCDAFCEADSILTDIERREGICDQ